jgi:hypothetical protein
MEVFHTWPPLFHQPLRGGVRGAQPCSKPCRGCDRKCLHPAQAKFSTPSVDSLCLLHRSADECKAGGRSQQENQQVIVRVSRKGDYGSWGLGGKGRTTRVTEAAPWRIHMATGGTRCFQLGATGIAKTGAFRILVLTLGTLHNRPSPWGGGLDACGGVRWDIQTAL